MTTVLVFLAVLAILVLVHELGHFLTAKAFGIKVLEFGFGYPPRLLGFRRGETAYSLNLLPLGGFVKLLGEEDPTAPRSLAGKSLLTRFIVISAGAFMNALLPIVIFTILFSIPQKTLVGQVAVRDVAPDSPAAQAGLKPGDIILSIDGRKVENTGELAFLVRLKMGLTTEWRVLRGQPLITGHSGGGELAPAAPPGRSETLTLYMRPRWKPPPGQGPTGIVIATLSPQVTERSLPVWRALPQSIQRLSEILILFRNEVISWVIGGSRPQLAGPIGIAQMTGEVARAGWGPLLDFTALLSINLAILNVLPIPMLDGGRLLFLGIEWVRRGKRIPPEREGFVHLVGFVVLLGLIALVSYFDIHRLLQGESLLR